MLDTIRDSWQWYLFKTVIWEYYSRSTTIFGILALIVYKLNYVSNKLPQISILQSTAEWVEKNKILLFIILFLGLLVINIGKVIIDQQKTLTPKVHLSFEQNGNGIVRTPVVSAIGIANAAYLRINIKNLSNVTIKDCNVLLKKIEKKEKDNTYSEIRLVNPLLLASEKSIYPSIENPVDFLIIPDTNKPEVSVPSPFTLRNQFDKPATYRFTITVIANEIAKDISVNVIWTGQWDKVDASVDKNANSH